MEVFTLKKEAMLYEKLNDALNCHVCNRKCIISNGKTGFCKIRENDNGILYSKNYASASSIAVDPIEKPLFHFYPGSLSLSLEVLDVILDAPTVRIGQYLRLI